MLVIATRGVGVGASDEPDEEPTEPRTGTEPLGGWERTLALVLGIAAAGTGGVATFITDNSAGTAVLLVVGAALVVIGIQGTPLIRLGGDTANIELDRRRKAAVEKVVREAAEEENPEVARSVIDAVAALEPSVSPALASRTSSLIYESEVHSALSRLVGHGITYERLHRGAGADFQVRLPGDVSVSIIAKYIPNAAGAAKMMRDMVMVLRRWPIPGDRVLVVANDLGTYFESKLLELGLRENFVKWDSSLGDEHLLRAMQVTRPLDNTSQADSD